MRAWQYFILKLASVPAPAGSRPAPRASTSSARGATRRTPRNWSTKSTKTCRSGPRTTPENTGEAADEHERANGRLYSEVQFALPKELNEDERREAASSFAERLTGGERLPYTLAIHRGGANGENPHAHLMFSERGHDGIERSGEAVVQAPQREGPGERGGAEVTGRPRPGTGWRRPVRRGSRRRTGRSSGRAGPSGSTGAAWPICETKRTGPET